MPHPLLNNLSFSKTVYAENGQLLRLTLSQDDQYRLRVPLNQIPQQFRDIILFKEDRYFRYHPGINPIALLKAIWQTYILRKHRIGASTITMQLARIRYHLHTKTMSGKLLQIVYALNLEMHYSKNQILEAYLNLAPFGNNIEGVGAASLIYFGKPINQLSFPDFFTLSIIPQNPIHRLPEQQKFKKIRNQLFYNWIITHPEDKNKKALFNLPIQIKNMHQLPFIAPHFVNELLQNPQLSSSITSTLNTRLQTIIEKITQDYLARKKFLRVENAAVLLVDSRDMSIKALLGSANFLNTRIQGQVDGTLAKRSPGSTLKPFIYGLAIDQGLIYPDSILKDAPHHFGYYDPENFDYDFMGPIKAKDALTLSRNIPAVLLAEQLNTPSLYTFLEKAHIANLKSENYYGLALVLGGAELTMQEIAGLYTMLLNDGIWYPLRKNKMEVKSTGVPLLSPEASYLVVDMLKNETHSLSYKTGTSSGYRDAWSVGLIGPYVLVVWLGNFNNESNPALIGKTMAAPLLFELADGIKKQIGIPFYAKDPSKMNLVKIAVCKASGMLPTRYCQDTELAWFIPGKSPIKTDTIFREVAIDKKTGLRTCHFNKNTRFEIYEFWPSDLLAIFRKAGIARRSPPAFDSSCQNQPAIIGISPSITSPESDLNYIISNKPSASRIIPLSAITDADVSQIYWFANETFIGKMNRDTPLLWTAPRGHYVVRVVDDHGRSDAKDITIRSGYY